MFGRYKALRANKGQNSTKFTPQDVKLEGYDMPLKTTPDENQFNAPGGLEKGLGGYHAWQSRDMKTWVHHGPVTRGLQSGRQPQNKWEERLTFTMISPMIRTHT